ncbi:MAG: FUSC family protein, partial [Actinomycetota bacterium]
AIVIPLAAALSFVIAGPNQTPVFTIVGSIALLIVADFPGTLGSRALAYLGLGINGALLITLGSLAAPHPWAAVLLSFAVGALVSVLGLLSDVIAAGQRATLMTFILPVCIRPVGPISDRLLGWILALTLCVPAALFLFPPRRNSELRRQAARVCTALANRIEGTAGPEHDAEELSAAMEALRAGFHRRAFRPVALTAGSRALIRVVSNLQWLSDRAGPETSLLLGPISKPCVRVLRGGAEVLNAEDEARDAALLATAVTDHRAAAFAQYDLDIGAVLAATDDTAAMELGRELLNRRTMSATIGLTGSIIAGAALIDTRPLRARMLEREPLETGIADRVHGRRTAFAALHGYLSTGSITVLNSVRTGLALALAVLVTMVFPVQNAPWIVLGALSVLRSSALGTGTTVIRTLAGTTLGIALGALVMALLGVDPPVMWILLPIVAFGSTYISVVGSFTASQAMFTMMVMTVFNLMRPTGWQVGLVRIEDILVGALVGLVVSLLLWPRGAVAAVKRAKTEALATAARYLEAAVLRVTRGSVANSAVIEMADETLTALRTYGDAVLVYISESGGAADPGILDETDRLPRLRTTADLIADIVPPRPGVFPRTREILEEHTAALCERLAGEKDSER